MQQLSTRLPIKRLVFVQDSDEEKGDATQKGGRTSEDRKIEALTKRGEGDHGSPKGKSIVPEWLEKQLERRTPILKDPREKLEAILARAQITTKKEKKLKIRSKVTMDASGSQAVQIATPIVGQEGVTYNISTMDLGTATREQKVGHLEESVAMVVHLIKQDKILKDELKAQVAALTDYIQ